MTFKIEDKTLSWVMGACGTTICYVFGVMLNKFTTSILPPDIMPFEEWSKLGIILVGLVMAISVGGLTGRIVAGIYDKPEEKLTVPRPDVCPENQNWDCGENWNWDCEGLDYCPKESPQLCASFGTDACPLEKERGDK